MMSHRWVRCGCGRQGYYGELTSHLSRCWGGRMAYRNLPRNLYGGGLVRVDSPVTQAERYEPGEGTYACRSCGHIGPGHRYLGVCPDMLRLEPHLQRLINHAREGGGRRRRRRRHRSYDDYEAYAGYGADEGALADAVEDLADAVAVDGHRHHRRRHHHHHRHSAMVHAHHHHRAPLHRHRHRYRRSRSIECSDCEDDDDGCCLDDAVCPQHRFRSSGDIVDDLVDAMGRTRLVDVVDGLDCRGRRRCSRHHRLRW